jgi:hypothetical protein
MKTKSRWPSLLLLGIAAMAGCGARSDQEYVPDEAVARGALAAALDAWQAGGSPDKIETTGRAVQAQEPNWRAGKKLGGYEIIGPATGAEPHRSFKVRLHLPEGPQDAVYVVVGKDPIWVFNEVSFRQLSGGDTSARP